MAEVKRASFLCGSVARNLDRVLSDKISLCQADAAGTGVKKHEDVQKFIEEYKDDELFAHILFPNFSASKVHQIRRSTAKLKERLLRYSTQFDNERYVADVITTIHTWYVNVLCTASYFEMSAIKKIKQ